MIVPNSLGSKTILFRVALFALTILDILSLPSTNPRPTAPPRSQARYNLSSILTVIWACSKIGLTSGMSSATNSKKYFLATFTGFPTPTTPPTLPLASTSTTVTFFHAILLLFLTLRLRSAVSGNVIGSLAASIRVSRQKCHGSGLIGA
ncbi:hypothetical protein D3C86_1342220 [compost metagenome]